jgi:hypothetical protein
MSQGTTEWASTLREAIGLPFSPKTRALKFQLQLTIHELTEHPQMGTLLVKVCGRTSLGLTVHPYGRSCATASCLTGHALAAQSPVCCGLGQIHIKDSHPAEIEGGH